MVSTTEDINSFDKHDEHTSLHGKSRNEMDEIKITINLLKQRLNNETDTDNDVSDLDSILSNPMMQALIKMHESMTSDNAKSSYKPISNTSVSLIHRINDEAERNLDNISSEFAELSLMLRSSPHIINLLECHDQVATKNFEPLLPEIPDAGGDYSGDDQSIKVVRLVKGNEPLGATIALDDVTGNIIIARILKGGAADRSGLIHVGDILVEVNNIPSQGKEPDEIIKLLSTFRGPLTFRLIPGEREAQDEEKPLMFVKAHVNYNPMKDILIPCPEAGLLFSKNDILEIVSKDDSAWWQAIKTDSCSSKRSTFEKRGGENGRAGLIPSAELHSKRVHLRRQASLRTASVKGSTSSLSSQQRRIGKTPWSLLRSSFRKSHRYNPVDKKADHTRSKEDVRVVTKPLTQDVIIYEEVTLMPPLMDQPVGSRIYRPIVLVGPQGVGRNELKDRLIDTNPTYYGVPIPHTSRAKQDMEEDGKDYHFVSREVMEASIKENKFLEYGEYKGNLYGTSLQAVREVIHNSQVCILTPYPQALKYLKTPELKPYIIFIKPPPFKQLYQDSKKSSSSKPKLTIDRDANAPFMADELKDLSKRAEEMERMYSHMFDCTIINDSIDRAYGELKQVVFDVEHQPQWVPKDWIS